MKKEDLTGKKFNKLLVLGRGEDYISPSGSHLLRWKCRCDCGNEINATTSQLKRGLSSCGCVSKREDLSGRKYGRLLVLFETDDYISPKGSHMTRWHCKCDCGNEIDALGMSLKNGDCKSCGCLSHSKTIKAKDYTGLTFGDLYVESKLSGITPAKYHCICSCGKGIDVYQKDLTSGRKKDCGCKKILEKENGNKSKNNNIKNVLNENHKRDKISIVGNKYGNLTVIEELPPHITPNGSKQRIVRCQCACGNVFDIRLSQARKNQKCSKCASKDRRIDITGKRFGGLLVTSMADDYYSPSGNRLSRCNCLCDCGNTCTVLMSGLVTGSTTSCGCKKNTAGLLVDNMDLLSKYDYEKNAALDISTLTARSSKKIWWKCSCCGNSWYATIASQNDSIKHGCPYCSGRLVVEGKNDLQSQCPEIALEWDYEKNDLKPNQVSKSSSIKYWWKCSECGTSWKQTVANRTGQKSGCPKCNIENTNSFCEQAVYYYIRTAFPNAINGDTHIGMELDIYIPERKVAIEYDGEAWHASKKKRETDLKKNNECSSNGITLIRIREPRLKNIENCIEFVRTDSTTNQSLDSVIIDVLLFLGVTTISVNTTRDTSIILEQYATKKRNNSLAYWYPTIASEWHPTKNGALTPEKVNKGARFVVWWLGKCGHEWQAPVSSRTAIDYFDKKRNKVIHKAQGCPFCAGKRVLAGFNDLQSNRPEIAALWDYQKNSDIRPNEITRGSSKKYGWKCSSCGNEWIDSPNNMCAKDGLCPNCKTRQLPIQSTK